MAALMVGAAALPGCGSTGSGNSKGSSSKGAVTTLEYAFWGNQNEINAIMDTIDEFNATHDDIQVKGTGMDSSVYLQKLSAYASSNTMPDIIQVAMDYGDVYTQKGMFAPLDDLIEENNMKNLVNDNLWEGLSYDGKIYAVPLTASGQMLVGNKDLFEEAGIEFPTDSWTEEEFKEAAIALTDPAKKQYGVIWGDAPETWTRALYGNGKNEIYDRENKTMNAVGNDAVRHAIDFMVNDIMQENKAAPAVLSSDDIGGGFETGKYGMAAIGFWDIESIHKVVQDSFEWDLLPLPTNDEFGQWKTRIFANALSISNTSKNKEAAFEYLKWTLENEDVQKSGVMLPVNKTIIENPDFINEFSEGSKVYNKQLAFDALNNGCLWQNTGTIAEINTNVINPEIEKMILKPDTTTLDEALENIQVNGQKLFDAEK